MKFSIQIMDCVETLNVDNLTQAEDYCCRKLKQNGATARITSSSTQFDSLVTKKTGSKHPRNPGFIFKKVVR